MAVEQAGLVLRFKTEPVAAVHFQLTEDTYILLCSAFDAADNRHPWQSTLSSCLARNANCSVEEVQIARKILEAMQQGDRSTCKNKMNKALRDIDTIATDIPAVERQMLAERAIAIAYAAAKGSPLRLLKNKSVTTPANANEEVTARLVGPKDECGKTTPQLCDTDLFAFGCTAVRVDVALVVPSAAPCTEDSYVTWIKECAKKHTVAVIPGYCQSTGSVECGGEFRFSDDDYFKPPASPWDLWWRPDAAGDVWVAPRLPEQLLRVGKCDLRCVLFLLYGMPADVLEPLWLSTGAEKTWKDEYTRSVDGDKSLCDFMKENELLADDCPSEVAQLLATGGLLLPSIKMLPAHTIKTVLRDEIRDAVGDADDYKYKRLLMTLDTLLRVLMTSLNKAKVGTVVWLGSVGAGANDFYSLLHRLQRYDVNVLQRPT